MLSCALQGGPAGPKLTRLPPLPDYQFYNIKRLQEINDKQNAHEQFVWNQAQKESTLRSQVCLIFLVLRSVLGLRVAAAALAHVSMVCLLHSTYILVLCVPGQPSRRLLLGLRVLCSACAVVRGCDRCYMT